MKLKCQKCLSDLNETASFCPKCGEIVDKSNLNNKVNRKNKSIVAGLTLASLFIIGFGAYSYTNGTNKRSNSPDSQIKGEQLASKESKADNKQDVKKISEKEANDFNKKVVEVVDKELEGKSGVYRYYIQHLSSDKGLSNGKGKTLSASTIKLFIMMDSYQQANKKKLNLSEKYELNESDKVEGTGVLRTYQEGTNLSIEDLIQYMMVDSDNTAANLLIKKLGGCDAVSKRILEAGFKETELNREMNNREKIEAGVQNYTSAEDVGLFLNKLYKKELVDKSSSEKMLKLLSEGKNKQKLLKNVPTSVKAYNKTGELQDKGVQNDAMILEVDGEAICVVMMTENGDEDEQFKVMNKIGQITSEKLLNKKVKLNPLGSLFEDYQGYWLPKDNENKAYVYVGEKGIYTKEGSWSIVASGVEEGVLHLTVIKPEEDTYLKQDWELSLTQGSYKNNLTLKTPDSTVDYDSTTLDEIKYSLRVLPDEIFKAAESKRDEKRFAEDKKKATNDELTYKKKVKVKDEYSEEEVRKFMRILASQMDDTDGDQFIGLSTMIHGLKVLQNYTPSDDPTNYPTSFPEGTDYISTDRGFGHGETFISKVSGEDTQLRLTHHRQRSQATYGIYNVIIDAGTFEILTTDYKIYGNKRFFKDEAEESEFLESLNKTEEKKVSLSDFSGLWLSKEASETGYGRSFAMISSNKLGMSELFSDGGLNMTVDSFEKKENNYLIKGKHSGIGETNVPKEVSFVKNGEDDIIITTSNSYSVTLHKIYSGEFPPSELMSIIEEKTGSKDIQDFVVK